MFAAAQIERVPACDKDVLHVTPERPAFEGWLATAAVSTQVLHAVTGEPVTNGSNSRR
jgi:hypothetical protein